MKTYFAIAAAAILSSGLLFFVKQNRPAPQPKVQTDSAATPRQFPGGTITIERTVAKEGNYTNYLFSYPSDNLKIYGMMHVPAGKGPFPVIIVNHGYFNQATFTSGDGTHAIANILAANGYLTLASDYRGFGKSENDGQRSRGHNPNYAIDVLNLIASVKSLDNADTTRIGMWGHSMGGEVSIRVAEASNALKAVVLWAPTSTSQSVNASFYSRGQHTPAPTATPVADASTTTADLRFITAPVSLHQGLADTEVNPQWSKDLAAALRAQGKTIEYFEYPGQDHNFKNLGWDVIAQRTVAFFDRYVK